jgi:hypothetical protein
MKSRSTLRQHRIAISALAAIAAWFAGCDLPPEEVERQACTTGTDDGQINSCYYCCFAEPGHPGAYTGCFSGPTITEERCREHLIDDKSCTDPFELEIQLSCECEIDCEEPDWF